MQGGSSSTLYKSVWGKILSLPDNYVLYPAHDYKGQTASTVAEEKKFNPRSYSHFQNKGWFILGLYFMSIGEIMPQLLIHFLLENFSERIGHLKARE